MIVAENRLDRVDSLGRCRREASLLSAISDNSAWTQLPPATVDRY